MPAQFSLQGKVYIRLRVQIKVIVKLFYEKKFIRNK